MVPGSGLSCSLFVLPPVFQPPIIMAASTTIGILNIIVKKWKAQADSMSNSGKVRDAIQDAFLGDTGVVKTTPLFKSIYAELVKEGTTQSKSGNRKATEGETNQIKEDVAKTGEELKGEALGLVGKVQEKLRSLAMDEKMLKECVNEIK